MRYIKQYVVTYPHSKQQAGLLWDNVRKEVGPEIEVIALDELLRDEILPGLRRSGSAVPTIPEGYWLLCLLAYARDWEIMQGTKPVHQAKQRKVVTSVT